MATPLQWHKRHAITLAAQLPENTEDALMVIEVLRELVENYLMASPAAIEDRPGNVLQFTAKPVA